MMRQLTIAVAALLVGHANMHAQGTKPDSGPPGKGVEEMGQCIISPDGEVMIEFGTVQIGRSVSRSVTFKIRNVRYDEYCSETVRLRAAAAPPFHSPPAGAGTSVSQDSDGSMTFTFAPIDTGNFETLLSSLSGRWHSGIFFRLIGRGVSAPAAIDENHAERSRHGVVVRGQRCCL